MAVTRRGLGAEPGAVVTVVSMGELTALSS